MTPTNSRSILALLRIEGAAAFAAGLACYSMLADGWLMLVLFALAPDLAMIGYLFGLRTGTRLYNLAHTYAAPALLGAVGVWTLHSLLPLACIWVAHIGLDRALGYGLKSGTSFSVTHLGRIGRAA